MPAHRLALVWLGACLGCVIVLGGSCWLDRDGELRVETGTGVPSTGGGGAGTGGSGGSGATTTTSSSSSSSTAAGGGGQGGTPILPVCGDDVIAAPEQCEDGNTIAGDGCSDDCAFEADCGNNTIEPGEGCEQSTPCASCVPGAGSVCNGLATLPLGPFSGDTSTSTVTTFGAPATDFAGTDCDDLSPGRRVSLFRHEVGAYPEGLALFVYRTGAPSFTDATAASYLDCDKKPVACSDDAGHLPNGLDSAMLTRVLPAGSVLYLAIGHVGPGPGDDYAAEAYPFRFGRWFRYTPVDGTYSLAGGWVVGGEYELAIAPIAPVSSATATTPTFYVGGLSALDIHWQQALDLRAGAVARIELQFDGGDWAAATSTQLAASDDDPQLEEGAIVVPTGAKWARLRFVLDEPNNNPQTRWRVFGVVVGRPI